MGEPKLRFKADDGSDFPNWEEKTLGELCEPLTYGMNAAATKFDGENRYIRITDIDDETHAFLSNDVVSPSGELDDKYLVKKGDILLARTGASTGKSYLYHPKDGKLFYAGFLIKAHVLPSSDDYFIYSQTLTDRYGKWVKTTSMRSGQPGINANEYASYSFSVPSLPEQRKIADLLSAVDDVIAAQEAEVAAWEKRKKGVMQKLFSQEVRFKADDGSDFPDWEERTFADVFIKLRNNTLSKDCLNAESGQARNIHYGDVLVKYGFIVDIQNNQVPFVNSDVECKRWDRLKDGDIVIADTAEDDSVGKAVEVTNIGSEVVYSGLHTIACRPRESFARNYLGYYMNSDAYHDQLRPYMQGIKVTSVSKGNIALTRMSVPSLPEQREIADCLASLDDVIAKAKGELDAWRELKKGLLQQMFV